MTTRLAAILLGASILGAGALAFARPDLPPPASAMTSDLPTAPGVLAPESEALPAGHPPISGDASSTAPTATGDRPSLTWKMPSGWTEVASTSSFRLATYRLPRAKKDTDDADVSVSRAGGSPDANIARWIGQFDDAGKDTRTEKTVRGVKVTIVEVGGTFLGGGMNPNDRAKHADWMLLGAIVESRGTPYFFKATGPAATIRAARAAFLAMLDGITPA